MVAPIRVDTSDIERLRRQLGAPAKKAINTALARAVQRTGFEARDAAVKAMPQYLDRPIPYTLNSLRVAFDRKTITATVLPKDSHKRAENFVGRQIVGGKRAQKAFESLLSQSGILPPGWLAMPGDGADIDAFGNMNPGQIAQILSWFESFRSSSARRQNSTDRTRAKARATTQTKTGYEYFVVRIDQPKANGSRQTLVPGIYKRAFIPGRPIAPILIFVLDATYKPRFPLYAIGQKAADEKFEGVFTEEFNKRWPPRQP